MAPTKTIMVTRSPACPYPPLLKVTLKVLLCLLCLLKSAFAFTQSTLYTNRASTSALSATSESVSVGFIGCGTIAKAIATGLLTQEAVAIKSVAVSRRSEHKSSDLQESFPDLVSIYDDNQDVVDASELIFVTVLPKQTSTVLQELVFNQDRHSLVSLVSTSTLEGLAHDSKLPPQKVAKMICLPSVARHQGVSLVVPKQTHNPIFLKLLSALGGFVECENEQMMQVLMVPTGMMGPFYSVLRQNRKWLVNKGVPAPDASFLVAKLYWGMIQDALQDCDNPSRFDDLIDEQTPGGLNEQALGNLETLGGFEAYDTVMDALLSRLEGKSDGSLPSTDES